MSNQFFYEDGQGHVVNERGYQEPMDYVVDEEVCALQTVSSHTDYLRTLSREHNHVSVATHVDEPTDTDIHREKRLLSVLTQHALTKIRNSGRPRILNEEHKKVILECVDENPSIVLEQLMERLLQRSEGLKVSKTTLHRFVKNECNLLKKARFQPVDRNSEAKIQERLDWVRKWDMTDIDFGKIVSFLMSLPSILT
ncbi:hypothetical protein VTP01DRAFT_3669 [Rhizomucor pusillus]|uniref:uncharacterized protein n=1 Tax=Rhizomucor pusillus TaxID=4840 RepID=UPI003743BF41